MPIPGSSGLTGGLITGGGVGAEGACVAEGALTVPLAGALAPLPRGGCFTGGSTADTAGGAVLTSTGGGTMAVVGGATVSGGLAVAVSAVFSVPVIPETGGTGAS